MPEDQVKPKRVMSEEARKKLAESRRGKKWPEEVKAKMSTSHKGKKLSEEHKQNMANAHRGQKRSAETIERMIQAHKGKHADLRTPEKNAKRAATLRAKLTGVPRSEEVKAKIRAAKQVKPYIYSDEKRAKMSAAAKAKFARMTAEERRVMFAEFMRAGQAAAKEYISDTKPERVVEETLRLFGFSYEKQKRIGLCAVDFFIPETNTVIEVMGCYWHACKTCGYSSENHEKRREHDRKRRWFLQSQGYTVEYIWEHELQAYIDLLANTSIDRLA